MDRKKLENYKYEQKYRDSLLQLYDMRIASINRLVASYEGERVNNSKKIMDQEAEALVKIIDEIGVEKDKVLAEGNKVFNELLRDIDRIENPRYRDILVMRYLQGKELKQIAAEKHYDYYYLARLHGDALAEFDKLC